MLFINFAVPTKVKKMPHRQIIIYLLDIILLALSYLLMAAYKPASRNYLSDEYIIAFLVLLAIWTSTSVYFQKYKLRKKHKFQRWVKNILLPNFISLGAIAVFIVAFQVTNYSRMILFGTIGIATLAELFLGNLYYLLLKSGSVNQDPLNPPPNATDFKRAREARTFMDKSLSSDIIHETIKGEYGEGVFEFISEYLDLHDQKNLFLSTTTRFNVEFQPMGLFQNVVNLKRVNDIQYINKFFESVNRKIPEGGLFISCAETKDKRKLRILAKYPPVLNWIIYAIDFLIKRIFPKFLLTKKIYFLLTRGNNRVLSQAEVLGRLYSCGFEVENEKVIGNLFYFIARKIKSPAYDLNPTYGPFIKLRRIGKDGKLIRVYKFRTMHPFAEYLQDYIYQKNHLQEGGKFNNDFRISGFGVILRKLWLDELPMLINVVKGEMKIVGVRPLSTQYFELYCTELQEKRIQYKPGLIPPFYADMPKTLEEIQQSELAYLDAYRLHPFKTDMKYFGKAFVNIVFKKARSN
jgi:lipopolysaccharide/colanic/teichoic acid biosynthesis glycosyltransferase